MINRFKKNQGVGKLRRFSMMPVTSPSSNEKTSFDVESPNEEIIEQVMEKSKAEIKRLTNYGLDLLDQVRELEENNQEMKTELTNLRVEKDLLENSLYDEKQKKVEIQCELEEKTAKLKQSRETFNMLKEDFQRLRKRNGSLKRENEGLNERLKQVKHQMRQRRQSMPSPSSSPSKSRPGTGLMMDVSRNRRLSSPVQPEVIQRMKSKRKKKNEIVNKAIQRTRYNMERRLSRANNEYHTKLQRSEADQIEARKVLVEKSKKLAELQESVEKNGLVVHWIEENKGSLSMKINELATYLKDTRVWSIRTLNCIHEDFQNVTDKIETSFREGLEKMKKDIHSNLYPTIQKKVISDLGILELYDKGELWPSKSGMSSTCIFRSRTTLNAYMKQSSSKRSKVEVEEEGMMVYVDKSCLSLKKNEEGGEEVVKWSLRFCRHFYSEKQRCVFIEFFSSKEEEVSECFESRKKKKKKKKKKRRRQKEEKEEAEEEDHEEEESEECWDTCEVLGLRFENEEEEKEWRSFFEFLIP